MGLRRSAEEYDGLIESLYENIETLMSENASIKSEVAGVLVQLDELAELWSDAAKFRRCRDRLRAAVAKGGE